jgi:hypothetical protein
MANKMRVEQAHIQASLTLDTNTMKQAANDFPIEVVALLEVFSRIEARRQKRLHAARKAVG